MFNNFDNVTMEKVLLTPAMATELLDKNTRNRKPNNRYLKQYVMDMIEGKWQFNGETIKIASNGILIDGQHRLLALESIADSHPDFQLPVLLVNNLDENVIETIDSGNIRTAKHLMEIQGDNVAGYVADMINFCIRFEETGHFIGKYKATTISVSRWKDNNSDYVDSIDATKGIKEISRGLASALHFEFTKSNRVKADLFFDKYLGKDLFLPNEAPVKLKEVLNRPAILNSKRTDKGRIKMVALFIKAWNRFLMNKKGSITWNSILENFPTID